MVKRNKSKIIIYVAASIIAVGMVIGSYFVGYNTGKNEQYGTMAVTVDKSVYKLDGVYKRSYYNEYAASVDSFVILRGDNSCRYISSIKTSLSPTINFNDSSNEFEKCTYEYDDSNKNGEITIVTYVGAVDGEKIYDTKKLYFTFNYGSLSLGGSTYSRIQDV